MFLLLVVMNMTAMTAGAQGWLDAVKKIATDAIDNATGGQLTAKAIVGTWNYKAPASRLDGGDILSSAGGALMGSSLNAKLESIFEKVGIKEGFCSVTFGDDGSFSMPVKSKTVSGTYEFDPSTHAITLTIGKKGSFTGYAYINGLNLEIVFPVNKLVDFVTAIGSKISALSTITSMLDKLENAYIGFEFASIKTAF